MSKIEQIILKTTGKQPQGEKETRQKYLHRLLEAIADTSEDNWNSYANQETHPTDAIQQWYNNGRDDLVADKNAPLEDFPDVEIDASEDDDDLPPDDELAKVIRHNVITTDDVVETTEDVVQTTDDVIIVKDEAPEVTTEDSVEATTKPTGRTRSGTSLMDHAYNVLKASAQPLNCKQIVDAVLAKGEWTTTGKTPAITLNSSLGREITKGNSRFKKVDRGLYTVA